MVIQIAIGCEVTTATEMVIGAGFLVIMFIKDNQKGYNQLKNEPHIDRTSERIVAQFFQEPGAQQFHPIFLQPFQPNIGPKLNRSRWQDIPIGKIQ